MTTQAKSSNVLRQVLTSSTWTCSGGSSVLPPRERKNSVRNQQPIHQYLWRAALQARNSSMALNLWCHHSKSLCSYKLSSSSTSHKSRPRNILRADRLSKIGRSNCWRQLNNSRKYQLSTKTRLAWFKHKTDRTFKSLISRSSTGIKAMTLTTGQILSSQSSNKQVWLEDSETWRTSRGTWRMPT